MKKYKYIDIDLNDIDLDLKNIRLTGSESQREVIEKICSNKHRVFNLAKDIVSRGDTNPMDLPGVFKKDGRYIVGEGNRRITALKLLKNPDLAPENIKEKIEKLAEGYDAPSRVDVCCFNHFEDMEEWIKLMHNGEQDGSGRKNWEALQKARGYSDSPYRFSLHLMETACKEGFITEEDMEKIITTVKRVVDKKDMQDFLGLIMDEEKRVFCTLPHEDFKQILEKFMADLLDDETVMSRFNKKQVKRYVEQLDEELELSGNDCKPYILFEGKKKSEPKAIKENMTLFPVLEDKNSRPEQRQKTKSTRAKHIRHPRFANAQSKSSDVISCDMELYKLLESHNDFAKISHLYSSICEISFIQHSAMVCVGVWSFMESLSYLVSGDKFKVHFKGQMTQLYGIKPGQDTSAPIQKALDRLTDYGNNSKHSVSSYYANGSQIQVDWNTMTPFIKNVINYHITNNITQGTHAA